MMTTPLYFQGLYRFSAPASPFEVEQRALHVRYEKPLPHDGAKFRLNHAMDRQGVQDSRHNLPLHSLSTTLPTTRDGEPGHQGVLITGDDVPAFWSQSFPEAFPAERLEEYQKLQDQAEQARLAYEAKLGEMQAILQQVKETRRFKAFKIPMLRGFFSRVLFPKLNRQLKALAEERNTLDLERKEASQQYWSARDSFKSDAARLRKDDPDAFRETLWRYVEREITDVNGHPRQDIDVPHRSEHLGRVY